MSLVAPLPDGAGADRAAVAALLAVDPAGLGGVALRAGAGPVREAWLTLLRRLLGPNTPFRRVPLNTNDTALLGGLDLGATLQAGRPVALRGVLAQANGGLVLLAMAERLSAGTAARLAAVLDTGEVALERDGLAVRQPARLGMVALDEGMSDDEQLPSALADRLAFHVQLDGAADPGEAVDWQASDIGAARALLPRVRACDEVLQAVCAAALALGIDSLRAPLLALRVARAAAALSGELDVGPVHTALAARLVLAPRATQLPAAPPSAQDETPPASETEADPDTEPDTDPQTDPQTDPGDAPPPEPSVPPDTTPDASEKAKEAEAPAQQPLAESVLEAAQAAIPPGLLAALKIGQTQGARAQSAGRSGAVQKSQARGRPIGARRGEPRAGARLNVIETLRAAAPWQRLRRQTQDAATVLPGTVSPRRRIEVRREDFHVTRFKQVGQTTTLFVVDASGSSALHRLAEAKGAVELLLADCYVRRDRVAVLAFRGQTVELLLPPTRSLARAKRSLAALPGGGGTPLAAAIDAARELAQQLMRRGESPAIVLLTDGRANIARDGSPGRQRAADDAMAAARALRQAGLTALLLDTSPQPKPDAQLLADAMGGAYVPLPYAGAQSLSLAVRLATTAAAPRGAGR